jgi:MYXO-CTERM domain-containing protein
LPQGTGGTYGGTGGDYPTGGVGANGGSARGGAGGSGGNGAEGGNPGEDDDDGEVIVTHGGCSLASANASSSFAAFLVAALALLGAGRRRSARR